ncbi:MAG TPA: 4-(cytidine 5'-diphospho)-2-C-methyl-D-erythritol kinase [Bacteroidia bacterium]|nr:4-(cytidine 5'-diphospho)-2-C-methyl-D-erythritol kinase [Bacteroidia bacterium]
MIAFPVCKINIGLDIISKRSDGYHSIETIFHPVQWTDVLEIIPNESSRQSAEFKSSGLRLFGPKEKNLCIRAYELLSEKYDLPSVKIYLHKILPIGAGLGGGSSDATSTLVLLNKIFKLNLNDNELESLAINLGADCPFFIKSKPMLATGKGEILEPISLKLKNQFIVIVKPRAHISTAEAFANVKPTKQKVPLKERIQRPIQEWKDCIKNDFEPSIFEKYPGIRNIKNKMYKYGAVYASLSGSGSSVYGIFSQEKNLSAYFRSCTIWQGYL